MGHRRYRWSDELKQLVEVDPDWTGAERRAPVATEELTYGGLTATDGTPINTRRRHAQYMAANNLSLVSDWQETWAKAAQERAQGMSHPKHKAARLEAIRRAYETKGRR